MVRHVNRFKDETLGDGTAGCPWISNTDEAVLAEWRHWATDRNLRFERMNNAGKSEEELVTWAVWRKPGQKRQNPLTEALRDLGIYKHKRIPDIYKHNSISVRMEVLAAFIDTDGSLDAGTSYDLSQSLAHEELFDDIREIAQSLGFRMTKTHCMKTCTHKGVKKEFPAVRGCLYGDQRLGDIPVRIGYKKMVKERLARHDLYKFDLKPVVGSDDPSGSSEPNTTERQVVSI